MKKIVFALAAGSAMAVAAPASAQNFNTSADVRISQLQAEIQAGVQNGTISRSEAGTLREHLRSLRQTERQYAMDGINRTERKYINDRIRNLRQQINYAERAGDGSSQYGQNQWQSGFVDQNRDGFDDRDYDRDGRWDDDVRTNQYGNRGNGYNNGYANNGYANNGYGGMGGPYEEVSQVCGTSRGISGVLGALLGSDNCLNVGERVSSRAGLSALPYQYRNQFRDTGGYYHGYVNGRIVQVDARSGTVARIYDVD